MNYSEVLKALNSASLFELYRLREAIQTELEDPVRLELMKRECRVGQRVSYFDGEENRLVDAVILDLKRTRAVVENLEDGRRWTIPLFAINLDEGDVEIHSSRPAPDRNTLKVGDTVCFADKQGRELFGEVYKLNQKTAGILVGEARWRVAYGLLSTVIDGESDEEPTPVATQGRIDFDR